MKNINQNLSSKIHPSAIIEEGAQIGDGTFIGPFSIIRSDVKIGQNNIIGPHVIIEGDTVIGNDNVFYAFSVVGSFPQVINWKGGKSKVLIGNKNTFREHVTIQPGLEEAGGITQIGDNNLFMISSHVGHDCIIGNNNRITNGAGLAGHVTLSNNVIVSGCVGVHQFVNLGDYSFVAAGSIVTQDVPPFCIAQGNRATLVQINSVGLSRANFAEKDITVLKSIFRKLFYADGLFKDKLVSLKIEYEKFDLANQLFGFIDNSKRGICKYVKKSNKLENSEDNGNEITLN